MARFSDLPGWIQALIAIGSLIFLGGLAYGDVKGDVRVESTLREQVDIRIERSVEEIKDMLKEEMERHHPRN